MDQNGEDTGESTGRDTTADKIVRSKPAFSCLEQKEEKEAANYQARDSGIRCNLKIIVMGLFNAFEPASGIESGICNGICTEPGTKWQIFGDHLKRCGPDIESAGCHIFRGGRIRDPRKARVAADEHRTAHNYQQ